MIPPRQQWAMMVDITNHCHLHCSNCTRLLDHRTKATSFFMTPEDFTRVMRAVRDFPTHSNPCGGVHTGRRKVVGLIGGEPLLHPEFPTLVDIMCEAIPDVRHRGLWTSKDWLHGSHPVWGPYRPVVERLIGTNPTHDASGPVEKHTDGYINWNMHLPEMQVQHQPILTASRDLVTDPVRRWQLISQCWVQEEWSSTFTPKGFFFCEVAAALDMILGGPGGLPIQPFIWRADLWFGAEGDLLSPRGLYANQIKRACESCGACVPQSGRLDAENRDDVSRSHIQPLLALRSPRMLRGDVVFHESGEYDERLRQGWQPMRYIKGTPPAQQQDTSAKRLDGV